MHKNTRSCTCNLDTKGLTGGSFLSSFSSNLVGFFATLGGRGLGLEENR